MRLPLALAATVGLASGALAGQVAPGDVKIVDGALEQPLTDTPGDPKRGLEAFVGRKAGNCLACHLVTGLLDSQQFHGEVGPPLDGVADVYSVAELRARIVDPKTENPDTMMPSFYRVNGLNRVAENFEGKTVLTAQEVEDIIAYLQTLKE